MSDEKDTRINVENEDTAITDEMPSEMAEIDEEAVQTPLEQFFYHQRRAFEETSKALEALLPPNFREHTSEASREFTKGFRVLVDAAIDELKKISEKDDEQANEAVEGDDDDDDTPPSTGKTKVRVKVD